MVLVISEIYCVGMNEYHCNHFICRSISMIGALQSQGSLKVSADRVLWRREGGTGRAVDVPKEGTYVSRFEEFFPMLIVKIVK